MLSAQAKPADFQSRFAIDSNQALAHWQGLLRSCGSLSSVLDKALSMSILVHRMQKVWDGLRNVEQIVLSEYENFIIQCKVLGRHLTDDLKSCELGKLLVNAVIRVASYYVQKLAREACRCIALNSAKGLHGHW